MSLIVKKKNVYIVWGVLWATRSDVQLLQALGRKMYFRLGGHTRMECTTTF